MTAASPTRRLELTNSPGHLTAMIRIFLYTIATVVAETWIMHGTLLSQWWNLTVAHAVVP